MDDPRRCETNAKQFVEHFQPSKDFVDKRFDKSRVKKIDNQFDKPRWSKKCADNHFTALSREDFAEVVDIVGGQEVEVGQEVVVVEKATSCGHW